MDLIPWNEVGIGSGWLIVGAFVYAILSGRIVPRSTLDDVIHDRDEWRGESRIKDAQMTEKDQQLRHMAEVGRTVDAIMQALKRGAREEEPS